MTKELNFEKYYEILSKQLYLTPNLVGVFMERYITCCSLQNKQSGSLLNSYKDARNLYKEPYILSWKTQFNKKLKKTHQDKTKRQKMQLFFYHYR